MPELKTHLEAEWEKEGRKAKASAPLDNSLDTDEAVPLVSRPEQSVAEPVQRDNPQTSE